MKTFLLLSSLIACSSIGEVFSARGMQQIGHVSFRPRELFAAILRMFRNPWLVAGVAFLAASFFSFISLLSYADLSFVVPLTAVGYITNTLGAKFFLKEKISKERWAGTLLVTFGVAVVSLDGKIDPPLRQAIAGFSRALAFDGTGNLGHSTILYDSLLALRAALLLLIFASVVYQLLAVLSGLSWFADRRKQRAIVGGFTPGITIFKPLRGLDPDAYLNFASFCRQEYSNYQLLFGVRDEDDPAIDVIQQLMRDFPERDIQLVISDREIGHNAKISNLQNLYPRAKHDFLIISDSDIRVPADYLLRVIGPMADPAVGMVTCLYRGTRPAGFGELMENIGISATFATEVCSSRMLEGIAFALGSTIVMRRDILESIGGFPAIADYLADDFILGSWTARQGYKIVLSDCVVEHASGAPSLKSMLIHQLRWSRSTRISRPWGYRGLIFTYGMPLAILALPVWHFSRFAWLLLAAMATARFLPVLLIGVFGLKDFVLARYLYLVPLRDLMTFCIWVVSFIGDTIEWRGKIFRVLPGGKLQDLRNTSNPFIHSSNVIMKKER
jgi:ceramide glucosyltransferase